MTVHAEPSPEAGAVPIRERWAFRFRADLGSREKWSYVVWLLVGLIIAVPEIWAAAGSPPWPTISATVGHLEALWNPVAILIVALIAAVTVHAVRYPWRRTGKIVREDHPRRGRTGSGRLTKTPDEAAPVPVLAYFTLAIIAIVVGSALAATLSSDRWVLAYVLYGLVAIFCIVVPNILAFWFKRDVPFSTLLRTVADIERRWYPAALVVVAGLAVLLIHLAFYPWPDIFRHVTTSSP